MQDKRKNARAMFTTLSLATALATTHVGCAGDIAAEKPLDDSEKVEPVTYGLTLDDESAVVASFDAPDGRQIKFLEPEPGIIEVITAGRIGSVPLASSLEMRTVKSDQLYERLSGREAPSRLREISQKTEGLQSEERRTTPSTQAENGARSHIGQVSQALNNFDDSWLFDTFSGTIACLFGQIIVRHGLSERDLYQHNTVNGGDATVYNSGVEANVTGSFKYRNSFTWSSGFNYNLKPNFYINYTFNNNGINVKYDIKTYVNPHGSSYTACQRDPNA